MHTRTLVRVHGPKREREGNIAEELFIIKKPAWACMFPGLNFLNHIPLRTSLSSFDPVDLNTGFPSNGLTPTVAVVVPGDPL